MFLYRSALVMHRVRSHWLRPPLRVSGCRSQSTHSRSATSAFPSVAPVPARVSSTNPLRSLSLDGVNRSNCPKADRHAGGSFKPRFAPVIE